MSVELAPHGPLYGLMFIKRAIMAICAPITGTRAIGKAVAKATGADVVLRGGTAAIRVIDEGNDRYAPDFTRVYWVSPPAMNNELVYRCDQVAVTATNAGVEVSMLAIGGGTAHELDVGAKLMWWPPVAGMDPFLEVTEAITGAVNNTLIGALKQMLVFDELGISRANMPAEAWRSKLTELGPSGVVAWRETSAIEKMGKGSAVNTERFQIFVLNSNLRSNDMRRDDAGSTLDYLQALLGDRSSVDGFAFAGGQHIAIVRRGFVTAEDQAYVHTIDFNVKNTVTRIEARQWADWLITQQTFLTAVSAQYPDLADAIRLPDISYNMQ